MYDVVRRENNDKYKPTLPMGLITQRSRHGSGASGKSRRSGSFDGRWRSQSSVDSPDLSSRTQTEDSWHQELRESFLNHYALYLQDLGIHPIKTRTTLLQQKRLLVSIIENFYDLL